MLGFGSFYATFRTPTVFGGLDRLREQEVGIEEASVRPESVLRVREEVVALEEGGNAVI